MEPMRITPSPSEEDLQSMTATTTTAAADKKKKQKKSVVFAETVAEIIPIASPLQPFYDDDDDDDNNDSNESSSSSWKSAVWYQADELTHFRDQARDVCRGMRLLATAAAAAAATTTQDDETPQLTICSDDNDNNEGQDQQQQQRQHYNYYHYYYGGCTRGLEQRSCLERQRRKYMTTRFIVKAARTQQLNAQQLAELAQRCNAWAMRLAQEEGERDFGRAYNTITSTTTKKNESSSVSSSRKRLSSEREDLEMAAATAARLVRARVCC